VAVIVGVRGGGVGLGIAVVVDVTACVGVAVIVGISATVVGKVVALAGVRVGNAEGVHAANISTKPIAML
jgi:hypothetical protein